MRSLGGDGPEGTVTRVGCPSDKAWVRVPAPASSRGYLPPRGSKKIPFCCCFYCPAPSGCAGWAPRSCAGISGARLCLLPRSPAESTLVGSEAVSLPLSPRLSALARDARRPNALLAVFLLRNRLGCVDLQ